MRQKLLDENQHLLVKPPQDLETNFARPGVRTGRAVLSGVDRTKLRYVASVPAAIVAGIIEYLSGPRAGEK